MLWDRFHQGWGAPLEKPISLLNMGHCFQVPTHSATTIFHITISTTYKRHFLISLWERVPLEAETHLSLSVFLWIILKSTIWMLDGMLISKAVLFIDMDGLFMCTGAWGEAALTFICYPAWNAWYTCVPLSTPQNMKDVLEKKNCRGEKKISDWTQRLYLCICGSSVICCQNKLALVRCTFFLCSAHPLKMKILSSILSFELSSGGCGFRQTPAMCVILNRSSLRFHRLYSPMLF